MTSGLDSTSICMFWFTFYPEIDNPLILLYMKWVFSAYKSSPNKQGNSWIGVSVSNGCVWRTISHEFFKKLEHNLDFVPHMIYDTKAIIWHVRLSQIFSSGQELYLYWKCLSNKKISDYVDSIDEEREGVFVSSMNY